MHKQNFMTTNEFGHYNLSSSYPSIKPISSNVLPHEDFVLNLDSSQQLTRSWGSSYSSKTMDYPYFEDTGHNNSDLQPLTWLHKHSIIDIMPLDIEEEIRDEILTNKVDPLFDPQLFSNREELETQENCNIHDYVRFQAQRSNLSHQRIALRQHNSFSADMNHSYSYKANGHTKPNLSYTQLIFMAIETCKDRAMTVNDIYQWCEVNYPYYKQIGSSWKNSLRHNLSINKSFRRMPRDGQISVGKCDLMASEDLVEDCVSQRDNKQGGPGRGAYWIVDDRERKNLLESIYRSQQTTPLSDRNEQQKDSQFSLLVDPAKTGGPLLCIDGRLTDASTYLQSRKPNDDLVSESRLNIVSPSTLDVGANRVEDSVELEFEAMMRGLTNGAVSPGSAEDISINLTTSYNSQFSRPENHDSDSTTTPRLKNRRKSTHEKVRSYVELDSSKQDEDPQSPPSQCRDTKINNMTSVNVIVAPHFDHIYARYQQFLPPAIPSNMEKSSFAQQHDHDSNPDVEFLKNGFRDDDFGDNDNEEETVKEDYTIKTEMTEVDNQKTFQPPKFNAIFASTRRKIKRAINQQINKNSKRIRLSSSVVEVKQEMIELPNNDNKNDEIEHSDGYNTDSTMPMTAVSRILRRSSRAHKTSVNKRIISKQNSKLAIGSNFSGKRNYRPKRNKSRPLRIDETHELSAIRFLANLERRHQQLKNIDNLYKLNTFLNLSDPR